MGLSVVWLRCLALAAALVPGIPLAGPVLAAEPEPDCFEQLIKGSSARIDCRFPVRMTPEELEGVRTATRGLLQDATCTMKIGIERRVITETLAKLDAIFESPPHPVDCDVKTKNGAMAIKFTFAPRVEFKGGRAIKASPGMANVTGVSRVLSWPVKTWVNRSSEIEGAMLQVINAYVKRYGRSASAAP